MAITDLTVDMMIRPAETDKEMTLFAHGDDLYSVEFMLTGDKRLKTVLKAEGSQPIIKLSKPMPALATDDFTRVIMVYDFDNNTLRFYAGTSDISEDTGVSSWMLQNEACPIIVGKSLDGSNPFHGNITEVRIWTKSLRPEEIAETHMRRLTGYEYGLIDYYPMNEGSGTELADLASGATLTGKGLSWVNPQGISLALSGEQAELLPTNFSRAAAQDYTLMFWFQMAESANDSIALFTTYMSDSITMQIGYDSERLFFSQDNIHVSSPATLQAGEWHHLTLSVSKTYNTANLYLDGNLIQCIQTDQSFSDLTIDILYCLLNTLAQVTALVTVTQFAGFIHTGGCTGGNCCSSDSTVVQSDFHFDRGISARVKDLSAHDINDFKILFHNCLL